MKKRKKLKTKQILFLLLGLLMTFLSVKAFLKASGRVSGDSIVELETPVVSAENDGKTILVHGTIEMVKNIYDEEYGITILAPSASRITHRYTQIEKKKSNDDAYSENVWNWEYLDSSFFTGEATIGEYTISEELLGLFPNESHYTNFNESEIEKYFQEKSLDSLWLSNKDITKIHRSTKQSDALPNINKTKFTYDYFDPEGEVTILAKQKGTQLLPASSGLWSQHVYHGYINKKDITKEATQNIIKGIVFLAFAAVSFILALKDRFRSKKKKRRKS